MRTPSWLADRRQAEPKLTRLQAAILGKIEEMAASDLLPPMVKAGLPAFRLTFSAKLASFSDATLRTYILEFRDWLDELLATGDDGGRANGAEAFRRRAKR